jgi:hypothetical protein
MPRQCTAADANRMLRENDAGVDEMLRAAPDDVDPKLAARALLGFLEDSVWWFARSYDRLPRAVIRTTLEELAKRSELAWGVFVRVHVGDVDDSKLQGAWAKAVKAVLDLNNSLRFGSMEHRAKIEGVARDPRSVEAARAAAASRSEDVPDDILAVLLVDGADASLDALLPSLERALATRDGEPDAKRDRILRWLQGPPAAREPAERTPKPALERKKATAKARRRPAKRS